MIDFESEAAETYIETVRLADKFNVLHTLPHRPPCDASEAKMAGDVKRRVNRTLIPIAYRPTRFDVPVAHEPRCARCGTAGDVRLWRTIWASDFARQDLYRCRAGCSA